MGKVLHLYNINLYHVYIISQWSLFSLSTDFRNVSWKLIMKDWLDLSKLYNFETLGIWAPSCSCPVHVMSKEDNRAMEMFASSCHKEGEGLPWKKDLSLLPNNRPLAENIWCLWSKVCPRIPTRLAYVTRLSRSMWRRVGLSEWIRTNSLRDLFIYLIMEYTDQRRLALLWELSSTLPASIRESRWIPFSTEGQIWSETNLEYCCVSEWI